MSNNDSLRLQRKVGVEKVERRGGWVRQHYIDLATVFFRSSIHEVPS